MPYIDPQDRECLAPQSTLPAEAPGELNFQISLLVDEYLGTAPDYAAINEVVGALECAKLEVYRRIAAPYEDLKARRNGDVFTRKVNL